MFKKISSFLLFLGDHFKGVLLLLIIFMLIMNLFPNEEEKNYNLQEIKLFSAIKDVTTILEQIDMAKSDKNIKGVLLNINSPGGGVSASIELSQAIKELNMVKPVVAYASGTLASGSYYASIYSTKIIANPGSIVGSIGVIMQSLNIKELLDKIGLKSQLVKKGEYKEAGTPLRKWTKLEREELQTLIDDNYNVFIQDIVSARKLDINKSNDFANAHIFSAMRAKKLGLIDEVATISVAKKIVIQLSNVEKGIWKKPSKLDNFLEKLSVKMVETLYLVTNQQLESKLDL